MLGLLLESRRRNSVACVLLRLTLLHWRRSSLHIRRHTSRTVPICHRRRLRVSLPIRHLSHACLLRRWSPILCSVASWRRLLWLLRRVLLLLRILRMLWVLLLLLLLILELLLLLLSLLSLLSLLLMLLVVLLLLLLLVLALCGIIRPIRDVSRCRWPARRSPRVVPII